MKAQLVRGGQPAEAINLVLKSSDLQTIRQTATEFGTTTTDLIRNAVDHYLSNEVPKRRSRLVND